MSDAGVRLRAVLDDLENGRCTLGDAAARVRGIPLHARPQPGAYQVLHAQASGDLPAEPDHSPIEIENAYTEGRLTRFQYETLAEAAHAAATMAPGHGDNAPGGPLPA